MSRGVSKWDFIGDGAFFGASVKWSAVSTDKWMLFVETAHAGHYYRCFVCFFEIKHSCRASCDWFSLSQTACSFNFLSSVLPVLAVNLNNIKIHCWLVEEVKKNLSRVWIFREYQRKINPPANIEKRKEKHKKKLLHSNTFLWSRCKEVLFLVSVPKAPHWCHTVCHRNSQKFSSRLVHLSKRRGTYKHV